MIARTTEGANRSTVMGIVAVQQVKKSKLLWGISYPKAPEKISVGTFFLYRQAERFLGRVMDILSISISYGTFFLPQVS